MKWAHTCYLAAGTPSTVPSAPGTTYYIVPGTNTTDQQTPQARRWLLNERDAEHPRYTKAAINELLLALHRDAAVRALNPVSALSAEARYIITRVEAERLEAMEAGIWGDWWEGERKKGVTPAVVKAFKAARKLAAGMDVENEELFGLGKVAEEGNELEEIMAEGDVTESSSEGDDDEDDEDDNDDDENEDEDDDDDDDEEDEEEEAGRWVMEGIETGVREMMTGEGMERLVAEMGDADDEDEVDMEID